MRVSTYLKYLFELIAPKSMLLLITFLPVVSTYLIRTNFGEAGFIMAHSLRGYRPLWWRKGNTQQKEYEGVGYSVANVSKQRGQDVGLG